MDLTTDRLVLRVLQPADAEWISKDIAVTEVHEWLTSVPYPYTRKDGDFFVGKFSGDLGVRAICMNGEPMGVISILSAARLDPSREASAELGYWLNTAAWGRGVMTEACQAMIAWYFENHTSDLNSGWIEGNDRSEHVLRKLGFQSTGQTRMTKSHFHGKDVPVIRVSLPAS